MQLNYLFSSNIILYVHIINIKSKHKKIKMLKDKYSIFLLHDVNKKKDVINVI